MTFWEHLEELRWMFLRMLAALVISLVPSFIFTPWIFEHIVMRTAVRGGYDIINIEVTSQFFTHMKMSIYIAIVAVFPYLLFELWKFISPALYNQEKKGAIKAFLLGGFLFYIGCAVGYFVVFPVTFRFLAGYELTSMVHNTINLNSYTGLFNSIILIFGLCFEMPMLLWILSLFGVINRDFLKKFRRHAIVVILILAALITPTGDPVTLAIVFAPLYLLYEFSILLVKPAPRD
ncbi:MAG: twin-arginine translocase subunit TatC [Bacteroidales bacterium]|nr:twin-arginine translocase subunit TatC [Bacteroidales bacterium]